MRKIMAMALFLLFLIPIFASPQNWTDEELEVISYSKKCYDAWTETILKKDRSIWLETCNPMEGWSSWNATDSVLLTNETDERSFDEWIKGIKNHYWENHQPISIKIFNDVAVYYYYVIYNYETMDGGKTRYEDKRLEVFHKVNGVWRWSDAMVTTRQLGQLL